MKKSLIRSATIVVFMSLLTACGESESPKPIEFPNGEYSIPEPVYEYSEVTVTSLKALADFPIGVAVPAGNAGNSLLSSPERQDLVVQHFSELTAENIMKMDAMHPSEDSFNFIHADELLSFAANNELTVHGHVLVWHSQIPDWIRDFDGDSTAWVAMMENHVTQIATRYSGQLETWDVVNEAFNEDGSYRGSADGDDSVWYKNIGESFIEKAFIAARAADADVDLYYNDYNISWNDAKLDAAVAMAADFQARDIPINGIGFQMHISADGPDKATFSKQLQKVVDLGLKVKITELDLRMNEANGSAFTPEIAELQKKRYFDVVSAYLETVPAAQRGGVSVWGLIDADSWLIDFWDSVDWPLMFNDDYTPKPALQGFADALEANVNPDIPETPEPISNNILLNPDFELGTEHWFGHGSTSVTLEKTQAHSGNNSAKAADRTGGWNGIAHGMDGLLTVDETYTVSAWVKLANASSANVGLTIKLTDDEGDHYVGVNNITATDAEWLLLTGSYTHTVVGTEVTTYVYVEGPDDGVEYYIDDISVVSDAQALEEPVGSVEILANPDFEVGTDSWFGHGPTSVTLETSEVHSGNNSAKAADRTDGWNGIAHGLDGVLTVDEIYTVSAWVKLANASSANVGLTIKLTDDEGDHYVGVNSVTATDGEWIQLTGSYTHSVIGNEVSTYVYIEGPDAGIEYYIDDISIKLSE